MAKPVSPRSALLGLFILGQLAFMLLSNVLGFVKSLPENVGSSPAALIERAAPKLADDKGHGWQPIDSNLRWWAQLTGQEQEWALFAPAVGKGTGFPCLLLLSDDAVHDQPGIGGVLPIFDARNGWHVPIDGLPAGCRLLLSDNEPDDINDFFRTGRCRLRRYEGQLHVNLQPSADSTPAQAASHANEKVQYLRDHYRTLALAYLRWRLRSWQRDHADEPAPKQVVLGEGYYRIHAPDEPPGWDGPFLIPLARWQPAKDDNDLDWFDFSQERFVKH